MALRKDIWRIGIAHAPLHELFDQRALDSAPITWLPELPSLQFMADPFGLWRDGRLYVFAETYDYRDRIGRIEVLTFDGDLTVLNRRLVLSEPWHLSYPFLIEQDGETYMLPEANRSGALTLYRAAAFPDRWEPVTRFTFEHAPIDATPVFHSGLWWLFYTPAKTRIEKFGALYVAYAERLAGPWTQHAGNPVRFDVTSARPGGTPFVRDGQLVLPVQDCSVTYGGAMRALYINKLTPELFEAEASGALYAPGSGDYREGFHTMTAAGGFTLIDAKRTHLSPLTLALDVGHAIRKLARRDGR